MLRVFRFAVFLFTAASRPGAPGARNSTDRDPVAHCNISLSELLTLGARSPYEGVLRAAKGGASTSARVTLHATEFEPEAYETHAKQREVRLRCIPSS